MTLSSTVMSAVDEAYLRLGCSTHSRLGCANVWHLRCSLRIENRFVLESISDGALALSSFTHAAIFSSRAITPSRDHPHRLTPHSLRYC